MNATLTRSELEIVERIALGESKKEVAWRTHRSVYTVETTVKNAYEKLGFSKISELTMWYIGQKFNLSTEISELRKKVFAGILLILVIFDLAFVDDDFIRARRARRSRKQETEIVI